MSKLIPIKVAEQAMAVRDDEIARLKADLEKSDGAVFTLAVENECLKAEVEHLRKHRNSLVERLSKAIDDLNAALIRGSDYTPHDRLP